MTKSNDGGPAFPFTADGYVPDMGMSLRDYVAIHAPSHTDFGEFDSIEAAAEIIGIPAPDMDNPKEIFAFSLRFISAIRYQYADAMLAARSGGQDESV